MKNTKKWIVLGTAGALGLAVLGGGAAAIASTMDLRSSNGTVLPGGSIDDRQGVLDRDGLQLRVIDTSASVVTSPSPTVSPLTPLSVASAPSVVAPPAPAAPAPAPPAPVYDSPASPVSVASPVSAVSAGSN